MNGLKIIESLPRDTSCTALAECPTNTSIFDIIISN